MLARSHRKKLSLPVTANFPMLLSLTMIAVKLLSLENIKPYEDVITFKFQLF